MSKYHIAILPGDGVGKDVMDAAKIVLDTIDLDAEYTNGDIGWEFWKKEGNPLPNRTLSLLKETDCCLFGAHKKSYHLSYVTKVLPIQVRSCGSVKSLTFIPTSDPAKLTLGIH